jgi:8-oxo-dGTP diphosphatase
MKRSLTKKNAPGFWDGVGGHLEHEEINNPQIACLREIYEETRITENDINNLKLKYIILQRTKSEIKIYYIYFGNSRKREVIDTDEGKLYWISKDELLGLEFTDATRAILTHYLEFGIMMEEVLVGTVRCENNKTLMSWNVL